MRFFCQLSVFSIIFCNVGFTAWAADLRLLFLGDGGHHQPAARFAQLAPVMQQRGIQLVYTDKMDDINPANLDGYAGLIVYANTDKIEPAQEQAILEYVEVKGRGFIPLHCATYCFRNSDKIVALMGGQFQKHGGEVFSTQLVSPEHPIMKGFGGFESWDETYVHTKHNEKDRTVLEYRVKGGQADGNSKEPWTWVRTQGKGRVFYTAWGHDERTWGHAGFQNLVERGIRWACGTDVGVVPAYGDRKKFVPLAMTELRKDMAPFEFADVGAEIPNYRPGDKWGVQGDPLTKMQKPLSPAESLKHYSVPQGFELRLFASEKDFESKPIAMNWDERGRLWICETLDYPNELQAPGAGRDRIRVLEDTDGDGVADKFTVFADKLSIPTAIVPYRGGVIVQNATETLYLKDTNGDGKADVREVLITGWAAGDTHGGVSNFQYGLDNWFYAMQGYNDSEPTIDGVKQARFRMGFFRFRLSQADPPKVTAIEFLRSTNNNTWGFGQSEEGIVFGSTANHNPSVYLPIANRYYEQVRGWAPEGLGTIADSHLFQAITPNVRQVDQFGGYTAGAGHALYTARRYPEQYWNSTAFVCEPTGHLVGTFVISRNGGDFQSTSPCNLVAADDEWAAPIMAEVGPDGNVWVLDWYNFIVQHNPTPHGFKTGKGNAYESTLRDKKHGRIYRLVYTGAAPAAGQDIKQLDAKDPTALVAALKHSNMFWRKQAQRLLVERGQTDVVPQLLALVTDPASDALGLNVGAIHALQTLDGLGAIKAGSPGLNAVMTALGHASPGVRRNAAQVVPRGAEVAPVVISGLGKLLGDRDAQVQLAGLLALADQPLNTQAGQLLAEYVFHNATVNDRWLADAATSAAAAHAIPFLIAASKQAKNEGFRDPNRLTALLERVAEHVARSKPSAEETGALVTLIASAEASVRQATLAGLARGWPKKHQVALTAQTEEQLLQAFEKLPAGSKGQLAQLANLWGSKSLGQEVGRIVDALLGSMNATDLTIPERITAAQQLVNFRADDETVVTKLINQLTPQAAPEFATGIVEALSNSTAPNVGPQLVAHAAKMTPSVRQATIRVLMARPETTNALFDAIEAGTMQLGELALDQKQALAAHPNKKLAERAKTVLGKGGGLPNADRQKVVDEFLALCQETGDATVGKEVFKKNCAKCHTHSGEGNRIGPDLTGMAVHPKQELLVHILDPSRSVEGNYRVYQVSTNDGLTTTGLLAGESRTALEFFNAEGKKVVIQREDIDILNRSTKSLMPEGFEKQVNREEFKCLLEFLTTKGKYVPLPLAKAASIVTTKGMFHAPENDVERLIFADWGTKTFKDIPFVLIDPQGDRVANAILFHGTNGVTPNMMPKSVTIPCNTSAVALHFLGGISGWGWPAEQEKNTVLTVRLHYADKSTEEHELKNGVHFADYIRRIDVPESEFAFAVRGQQVRYLSIVPKTKQVIQEIEIIKTPGPTSPVIMAITAQTK